jgi:hypothetical protein
MLLPHLVTRIQNTAFCQKNRIQAERTYNNVLNETNGCNNGEDIYFLSYINMFRSSLCPSSGYECGEVA